MKKFFKAIGKFVDSIDKAYKIVGIIILGIIVLLLVGSLIWQCFKDTTDFSSFIDNLKYFLGIGLIYILIRLFYRWFIKEKN